MSQVKKYTHSYTYDCLVLVPCRIRVLADNEDEAVGRVVRGAWDDVKPDFNNTKETNLIQWVYTEIRNG